MDSIITEKCCYFSGNDAKKVGINLLIFIDRRYYLVIQRIV